MGDPIVEIGITKDEWNAVMELCDKCGVKNWDGFSEMKEGVIDGFSVEAEDTDGNFLWAEGSGAFPDGYEEFKKGIKALFEGYLN